MTDHRKQNSRDARANSLPKDFKDIPGYEGTYKINPDGQIISCIRKKSRFLKICVSKNGYTKVELHNNCKGKWHSVHRLVATTFIPNPENKPQVNHINGIKTDNRVENLEWVTMSENIIHSFNIGTRKSHFTGKSWDDNYYSKIKSWQFDEFINLYKSGKTALEMSYHFGTSRDCIYSMIYKLGLKEKKVKAELIKPDGKKDGLTLYIAI